jgi:creatinine amidohydrolase
LARPLLPRLHIEDLAAVNLLEMSWPAIDALSRDTPIVFPIAALEQHGRHMPLFTDSLLLSEVVRRVQLQPVGRQVVFAPLQWFGNSHHHLDFPGTLSASPRNYLELLRDLAECFLRHGFGRIVFINGHGGNTTPSQQALFELRQKYRERQALLLASLTYWDSASPQDSIAHLVQHEMGHACEWETSMMLAIRPELVVGNWQQVPEVPFGSGAAPAYRGWIMPDRSEPGHIGAPAAATAEKGEALLNVFAAGVTAFLQRAAAPSLGEWDL